MTNKNNIICLGVNELYHDKQVQYPPTTLPTLCFFEFTQTLQNSIDNAIGLLFEHSLHEVTISTQNVNWYFNLTDRYHHNIQSFIHVDATNISCSGMLKPYKQPHFSTAKISINQLKFNQIPINSINLNQLTSPLAKGLIKKIKQLTKQYSQQEELYYGIEPLLSKLRELDEALKGFEKTNYLEMVQPKLDRSVNIGAMEKFFKSLCIKYHVGIIIIDEFQNIDVANKDDKAKMRQLFDSMSNKLHVPFLKVGTTDSFGMMKAKFQHGRRAGDTIELLPYSRVPEIHNKSGIDKGSANGNDWKLLMKAVFDFQVIKKPIKYSTRWDEELYKLSCGIPYVLFTLWHEAQVNAIRTGLETITLKQLNDVYRQRFKLIKAAIKALRTERIGQFSDLLCIAQLFDKKEIDAAIQRLNHFVNKENFSGAAAADVLQSVEDIEKENTLKEPQKRKLAQIKSELKQRAATIKKGQVYDNQA